MSRSTNKTLTCACGEVFQSPVYEYVNVAQEPHLQYVVLAGLLNVTTCPNCGQRGALATPFIYSDPAHHLLAYVHPRSDAPAEARHLILEQLRSVYADIEEQPGADEIPPLQVVFGLDQLYALINGSVSPEERLGRLALSTQSRNEAERNQFLLLARKLAAEMNCTIEVENQPDEYVVWLYGSRRQIGALMRELTTHS
jgi:hypothetical protein